MRWTLLLRDTSELKMIVTNRVVLPNAANPAILNLKPKYKPLHNQGSEQRPVMPPM